MKLASDQMAAKLGESGDSNAFRPDAESVEMTIPSGHLLQGRSTVAIEHHGTQYFLRATRAGKLILTK